MEPTEKQVKQMKSWLDEMSKLEDEINRIDTSRRVLGRDYYELSLAEIRVQLNRVKKGK